mmetsp:Transcript_44521/g.101165  ORF Transcript_44521/g.101165 Transcript_44521/m.101165 type:complete len:201 (-) Transcript_44521:299-901(-)
MAARLLTLRAPALRAVRPVAGAACPSVQTLRRHFSLTADGIAQMQEMYRKDPSKAQLKFSSESELTSGLHSNGKIRSFKVQADEPPALGGTDAAPNPVELLLYSLGACQEITFKAYATAMGIQLDRVSVELKGHIDVRGFFAVDESVRAGFQKIEGTVTVESPAETVKVEQLKQVVDAHCPVKDMLQAVPMSIGLKHVRT